MNSLQEQPVPKKEKRRIYSFAGTLSLFIHLAFFLLVGGVVIVEQIIPKQPITGEVFPSETIVDEPTAEEPEEMPQATEEENVQPAAASSPSPFDTNTVVMEAPSQTFTISPLGNGPSNLSLSTQGTGTSGTSPGRGSGGRKVSFFGIESEAKAVGFYLDFSGTMDAPRKKKLLVELEKTLAALPDGMEVMVINWAGPAWSVEEQGSAVIKLWKGITQSNWIMESPDKIKAPAYIKLNNKNRKRIITLLEGTSMVAGATAWSSPFILAAKAEVAPDVIYFMTDGQFGEQKAMIENLNLALKKTKPANPTINVVGISPQGSAAQSLKELASKHDGKYIEIP